MLEKEKISFEDLISEIISTESKLQLSSSEDKDAIEKKLSLLKAELGNAILKINTMEKRIETLEGNQKQVNEVKSTHQVEVKKSTDLNKINENDIFNVKKKYYKNYLYTLEDRDNYEIFVEEEYCDEDEDEEVYLNKKYEEEISKISYENRANWNNEYDSRVLFIRKKRKELGRLLFLKTLDELIEQKGMLRFFPLLGMKHKKKLKKISSIFDMKYSLTPYFQKSLRDLVSQQDLYLNGKDIIEILDLESYDMYIDRYGRGYSESYANINSSLKIIEFMMPTNTLKLSVNNIGSFWYLEQILKELDLM